MDGIDNKIRRLDADLLRYRDQMSRLPEGPAKESLKRQALQVLTQKKQYESQRGMMMSQSFNLEQANFAIENTRANVQAVQAMKAASKELKGQIRKMDVGKVEDIRVTMEELMEDSQEIGEVLGRSYGMPEIEEEDLEAELSILQQNNFMETDAAYLDVLPPQSDKITPSASKPVEEPAPVSFPPA